MDRLDQLRWRDVDHRRNAWVDLWNHRGRNDNWVVFTNRNAVQVDLSAWGWIHIIVGAIVLLAGFGVFTGNILARIIGVVVALVSLIANFLWLPVYPVWSVIIITIDVLVIWALTAHGREMRYD